MPTPIKFGTSGWRGLIARNLGFWAVCAAQYAAVHFGVRPYPPLAVAAAAMALLFTALSLLTRDSQT